MKQRKKQERKENRKKERKKDERKQKERKQDLFITKRSVPVTWVRYF